MNEYKKNLTIEDKELADQVADEILTVEEDDGRLFFLLLLILLLSLGFLFISLSFAIFSNYYNGSGNAIIDVGTNIIVKGKDKPSNDIPIEYGSVFFNFNEGSNYIYMTGVYPTSDNVGKKLTGEHQYFDFNISSTIKNMPTGKLVYEISLVPIPGNTISPDDIRVYLVENGKEVSINDNMVNNFSDLPDSEYRSGAKVIHRRVLTDSYNASYIFRMWYSYKAEVTTEVKTFGCKVAVDAYYR